MKETAQNVEIRKKKYKNFFVKIVERNFVKTNVLIYVREVFAVRMESLFVHLVVWLVDSAGNLTTVIIVRENASTICVPTNSVQNVTRKMSIKQGIQILIVNSLLVRLTIFVIVS